MEKFETYSDNELLGFVVSENEKRSHQAFRVLYARHSAKINAFISMLTRSRHDAEEIFQESWIRYYNRLKSGNISEFKISYIYTIARNLSIDKFKERTELKVIMDNCDFANFASSIDLSTDMENKELRDLVILAVSSLDEKSKEIFILRLFSSIGFAEIADITGVNIGTVKMRFYRATEAIVSILKPYFIEVEK